MDAWVVVLVVCLAACSAFAGAEEAKMVFDIFDTNPAGEVAKGEATVAADARDLHGDQVGEKQSVRVAAALVVWSEGMSAATDHSLFRIATHPSVEASLRMDITCIHRARSAAIHSVLHHIEQQMLAGGLAALFHLLRILTHHQQTTLKSRCSLMYYS